MKNRLQFLLLVVVFVLNVVPAWSAGNSVVSTITSSELKALIDRAEPGIALIDSRSSDEYQEAHIRGAVNIPLHLQESLSLLATYDKMAKLIFYCNGFT